MRTVPNKFMWTPPSVAKRVSDIITMSIAYLEPKASVIGQEGELTVSKAKDLPTATDPRGKGKGKPSTKGKGKSRKGKDPAVSKVPKSARYLR